MLHTCCPIIARSHVILLSLCLARLSLLAKSPCCAVAGSEVVRARLTVVSFSHVLQRCDYLLLRATRGTIDVAR